LAMKLAKHADAAAGGTDALVLNIIAKVHAERKEFPAAAAAAERALALAGDDARAEFQKDLDEIKKAGAEHPTRNAGVIVHGGVELLDFAGPAEAFDQAGFHVFTVGPSLKPVRSHGAVTVIPEFSIDNAPHIDVLVIPGGDTPVLMRDAAMMD